MRSHNERVSAFMEYYDYTKKEAEAVIDLFDNHIESWGYSNKIVELCLSKNYIVKDQLVRHVKSGTRKSNIVFNVMLEYAILNKEQAVAAANTREKLTRSITQ